MCQKVFRKIISMLPWHQYSKKKKLKTMHLNEKVERVAVEEIPLHRKFVSNTFYLVQRYIRLYLPNKLKEKKVKKKLFDFATSTNFSISSPSLPLPDALSIINNHAEPCFFLLWIHNSGRNGLWNRLTAAHWTRNWGWPDRLSHSVQESSNRERSKILVIALNSHGDTLVTGLMQSWWV